MNKLIIIPLAALLFLVVDWYVLQALKTAMQHFSGPTQRVLIYAHWSVTAVTLVAFFLYHFAPTDLLGPRLRMGIMVGLFINYLSKTLVVVVLLVDDLIRLGKWVASRFQEKSVDTQSNAIPRNAIPRSEFLAKTAMVVGAIPVVSLTWGIISGAHDYRVRRVKLVLKNLPRSFDGLKIAQLSDIHSGSFFNKTAVKGGVEMLLAEKPDVVFFTGDLVNNRADEVRDYLPIFEKVRAPLGVFSTLGNHDYGDYAAWESETAKRQNLQNLMQAHKLLGWNLMMDTHTTLKQNGDEIAIIGIQNWGSGRWPKYGNLAKAYAGAEDFPVKLLLSHDPSHWDAQVRPEFPGIDVQFAGHTHGMQFGIEIPGFRWSPAQYVYKQWAGMYEQGGQRLYVNRGYGYLGYPGRVGILPEITIFELKTV
ncbi:MAG: metallophosphoesterase [Cytophagaceae bacterium]|nr:metallophosphoesterase [Cytophagaceae bacterium]